MSNVYVPDRGEILAKAADGTLVDALFDDYGRIWLDENSSTLELLIELHNAGEIDLLAIVTPEAVKRHQGVNFFNGQHLFERLIPRISGSVREMVRVVEVLRVGGGADLAAGLHIEQFAKWCEAEPARPIELLALIDEDVPDADGYLIVAIKTGVNVDRALFMGRAYGFLESGTERQRLNALNALGQVEISGAPEWSRFLAALVAAQGVCYDDAFRGQMLSTAVNRLKSAPAERIVELERIAATAVAGGGDQTLYVAARILAFETAPLGADLRDKLIDALRGIAGAHNATIDMLDLGLSKLLKQGEVDAVRRFVEELLTRAEDSIGLERLDSVVRTIIDDGDQILADWVVAWMRNGNYMLCRSMDRAMFSASRDEYALSVDFSRYKLSDAEYPYLARKTIASFFVKPRLMASLLVSLLRTAPAATTVGIEQVLIDPVLRNYSGAAREYLVPIAEDAKDPAAPAVQRALDAQDAYLKGLEAPGRVPELHPSERERQLEWEHRADGMSNAAAEARKKSVFAQLVAESIILYGNRAVSWVDLPGEKPRRIDTELRSVATSFEIPRVDVFDPIGLDLMLRRFWAEEPPR
ncbi:hypothetical protein [Burkholderia gladioli]|uniref:hypothetical protein n=1 Tax=Burkholderia gladioli TaxID=28095 RepID=UPI00264F2E68|nr:hypothetical protein [Burkholderia gladioli]MDN7715117.1 hypothetical protein [Burkholderia gladioli]